MIINKKQIKKYVHLISSLRKQGKEIIFVSSGAVSCADYTLPYQTNQKKIPIRQALASLGQVNLMELYKKTFKKKKRSKSINTTDIMNTNFIEHKIAA